MLLVAKRLRGRLVHCDDFGRIMDAQACGSSAQVRLDHFLFTHEDELDPGQARLHIEGCRHRYMGAVIASHAIDGDRDQRPYSSLVLETFLPR